MSYIDAGSTKKIGKYELMISRPIGIWTAFMLSIYKYRDPKDVRTRKKVWNSGYTHTKLVTDQYASLTTVRKIEAFLDKYPYHGEAWEAKWCCDESRQMGQPRR